MIALAEQPLIVTREQLLKTWQQDCQRMGWPDTFDGCLQHELYGRLLRARALGQAIAAQRRSCRVPAPQPERTRPLDRGPAPSHPVRPAQAHLFDPKRLAAGDKPDDDD